MKRHFQLAFFLLLSSGMLFACPGRTERISGYTGDFLSWTGGDDESHFFNLTRVNGQDGTITNIGGFDFFPDMTYAPDGTLYGISNELHIIDPSSGATTKIGTFQYQSNTMLMRGAAFSPDGTLYVVQNGGDLVFTVDLTNAALTYVGTPAALIWDMEFASNETLYAAFADLFVLNASDMATVTTVGDTGYHVGPLTFGSGGTLYGMDIYPSTHIYSLSLDTGSATPIIAVGSDGLRSLVAERSSTAASAALFNKAVAMHGFSSPQSLETLLKNEKEIKAARALY